MSKHYDVVILGAGLGALATAALLARRSWRVLVLGQGWRPAHYSFDGLPLARRPFTFLGGSSPAWTRALAELAQSQSFRRHARPLDPMLQVLAPRLRLSIPADGALLGGRNRPPGAPSGFMGQSTFWLKYDGVAGTSTIWVGEHRPRRWRVPPAGVRVTARSRRVDQRPGD